MKIRVVVTAVASIGLALFTATPANAHAYDHKDPYSKGCGNSARAVRSAPIKSVANGEVGTVKLMWSSKCKTNWTEITTATSARGTVTVYTDRGYDRFSFKPGNGGRHWGNMMYAPGICAHAVAHVSWGGGNGGQNGSGATRKACG